MSKPVATVRTAPRPTRPSQRNLLSRAYLVEVFACGSHLLPGFVQQLDADAEEFLEGAIVREEHGMEVVAVFTGCGKRKERHVIMLLCVKRLLLMLRIADPSGQILTSVHPAFT